MTFADLRYVGGLYVVISTSACIGKADTDQPPVFGGRGAEVAASKEMTLPSSAESKHYGACSGPAPASDTTLLDDFEDSDNKPFKAFQREGWWFLAADHTEGAKVAPTGVFAAEHLPEAERSRDNSFAAHVSAEGQKQWGITFGASLNFANEGIRCPFNAQAFSGLKFRAKGPGTIAVSFSLPETVPQESGGVCTRGCYDTHRQVVFLTERWQEYEVRWNRLQQAGWGTEVRFDAARVIAVNFTVGVKELPADFWLDDIEFIPAQIQPKK